jgi:hypothetical protein
MLGKESIFSTTKNRISRNNICQLVLAKSYGINEAIVTINQLVMRI